MNGMPLAVTAWLRVLSSRIEAQLMSRLPIFSMRATLAGNSSRREPVMGRVACPRTARWCQARMNANSSSVNSSGLLSWTR
jgi:hypothetical protein